MKVVYFHRKPWPKVSFSMENLFRNVRESLPSDIEWRVKELTYFSEGFFKRFYSAIQAAFSQTDINHITGDIHFIALFLSKKRTVLTIHDIGFMDRPGFVKRILLHFFWITGPVHRSSVITTVSTSTKLELLKYVNVNPARIRIVYVPINKIFVKSPKEFNVTEPRILQIGTKYNKNIPRLLNALKGINCKLVIIGLLEEDLLKRINDEKINFEHHSNLSDNEVVDQYCKADIIAFVSTNEGFGMPIVEGNTVGRVVVTSNISSMPEIAGNAAHIVDPYDIDAIHEGFLKVINDKVYRDTLISNGFINRERFDVTRIANEYAKIYRLIGEK